MRCQKTVLVIPLAALAPLLAASAPARAEVTKTLRAEISGSQLSNFAVENLAGSMRVVRGPEGAVSVVATVHAESQELADLVRLDRVPGEGGAATLRVRYPPGVRTLRYRAPGERGEFPIELGLSGSTHDYDGRSYRVSRRSGKRVWADLEIRVPARLARARFRNLVGLVDAEGLEGRLHFDVATADLRLRRLAGELSLDGSSGDVRATDIRGKWKSDFASGDCELEDFEGETLEFHTSSGDVRAHAVTARRLAVETSSGDASFWKADLEEFHAEASSGDLFLEAEGGGLREVRAHTSSGNVVLRLPREASFEATADQSGGDMVVGFSDGAATRRHDKLVAYRRGSGGARIRVDTSSGDLEISPR